MKPFINKSKKALLHSAAFAVLAVLCCAAQSQELIKPQTKGQTQAQELALQSQYKQAHEACANRIAPAQCQREARLSFEKQKQDNKIKNDALKAQANRNKYAQRKANEAGETKAPSQFKQAATSSSEPSPLSRPSSPKAAPQKQEPLLAKGKPTKPSTKNKPLTTQPSAAQREANAKAVISNQQVIKARQSQSEDKVQKRIAKDEKRRAAGFKVEKP